MCRITSVRNEIGGKAKQHTHKHPNVSLTQRQRLTKNLILSHCHHIFPKKEANQEINLYSIAIEMTKASPFTTTSHSFALCIHLLSLFHSCSLFNSMKRGYKIYFETSLAFPAIHIQPPLHCCNGQWPTYLKILRSGKQTHNKFTLKSDKFKQIFGTSTLFRRNSIRKLNIFMASFNRKSSEFSRWISKVTYLCQLFLELLQSDLCCFWRRKIFIIPTIWIWINQIKAA